MCWSHYHHYRFEDRRQSARRSVSDPVDTPANVRVSDADRNRVIDVLKQHTGEGRLTLDEFEARVDEVLAARTGTDLRRVLRELPVPQAQPVRRRPSFPIAVPALPVIVMVVVFISLVAGHLFLLPLVFVAFFWFPIGAGRHRRPRWVYDPRRHTEPDDVDTFV
jgi:hypothetical protein